MQVHGTTNSREQAELTAAQLWAEGKRAAVVEVLVWNELLGILGFALPLETTDRYVIAIEA